MIVVGIQRTRILTGMQAVKTVSQAHTGRRLEVIYLKNLSIFCLCPETLQKLNLKVID